MSCNHSSNKVVNDQDIQLHLSIIFEVCNMAFEFRDKTEEYVQFIKDGEGIYYKGNVGLLQAILLLYDFIS